MAWEYNIAVGDWFQNDPDKKENNAIIIYNYIVNNWHATPEACCGIIGNMDYESGLNPGNMSNDNADIGAWGLIQWYPGSVIREWCANLGHSDWYNGELQMQKLSEEPYTSPSPYIQTPEYPYSWEQFLQLTDLQTATYAWEYNRERSGHVGMDARYTDATYWYQYFEHHPPTPPTPTTPKKKLDFFPLLYRKIMNGKYF